VTTLVETALRGVDPKGVLMLTVALAGNPIGREVGHENEIGDLSAFLFVGH
jgi:hypothetical protein